MVTGSQAGDARLPVGFRGFASDYIIDGALHVGGERLADFLEATPEIEIRTVVLRALDDGRILRLAAATIAVEELCLAVASGPRGQRDRRIRTRAHPLRAVAGPYEVVGYFHVATTADPLVVARRRAIVALSPATVRYTVAGKAIEETHVALLLVRTNVDKLMPATDEDVGLAKGLDALGAVDPQAKDLTGAIRSPGEDDEPDQFR